MTAADVVQSTEARRPASSNGRLRVATLVLGGLALGSACAALSGGFSNPLRPGGEEHAPLQAMLGKVQVVAPAALVRNPGAAGRVDLRIPLRPSDGEPEARIAVTLTPAGDGPNPESRVVGLYPRFFTSEVEPGPAGLVRRGFRPGSPYAGEIVLFAPPDGRRFSARCETAGQDGAPPQCLSEFRRKGVDVQLRFPPSNAGAWEAMLEQVLPRVEAMLR
jgi:hypothetical protein